MQASANKASELAINNKNRISFPYHINITDQNATVAPSIFDSLNTSLLFHRKAGDDTGVLKAKRPQRFIAR